jgi:hypothetical protein
MIDGAGAAVTDIVRANHAGTQSKRLSESTDRIKNFNFNA